WPTRSEAFSPLLMLEVLKSSTRLLALSPTYTWLLVTSKATPIGLSSPDWVVAGLALLKFVWPSTFEAFMPSLMLAVLKTSTRLLDWSATNRRLFTESKETPSGVLNPDWVVAPPLLVKFVWPSTFEAFMPSLMLAVLKTSTRLLDWSDKNNRPFVESITGS